ncbi:hypothetical protein ABVK25_005589 [Lepraria finkii]|uniref:Heterokaryon incompatibility domain-containing protein n=1 Tax=Lepraria finkii TaxID=1340010 RepID=A0ABR4B881_9LECA
MKLLPTTIQDTVTFMWRLGFEYLWIDALCILQDSAEDWGRESAIMGDIYRDSQCTISVTDVLDAEGGIFSRHNPLFQVPLLTGHTDETPVYVPSSVPSLESSSLSKRAWTFQERLLSRRVLHMGKQLMPWECYECSASEVDPNGTDYGNLRDIFQIQEL